MQRMRSIRRPMWSNNAERYQRAVPARSRQAVGVNDVVRPGAPGMIRLPLQTAFRSAPACRLPLAGKVFFCRRDLSEAAAVQRRKNCAFMVVKGIAPPTRAWRSR